MWQNPIMECVIKKRCLECNSLLHIIESDTKCKICLESKNIVKCRGYKCDFLNEICFKCLTCKTSEQKLNPQPQPRNKKSTFSYLLPGVILVVSILLYLINSSKVQDLSKKNLLGRLRQQFPSQKNETWHHILSALEQTVPTVKSITLLHKNHKKTSYCLARELVNIFSSDVKMEDVGFILDGTKYTDYGEVLEHYHKVVKRFRVLVTNLNDVPTNFARVFHSLCDEVSFDIKPSLFIFVLQCDRDAGNLKPLEKATAILKQAWSELPDSDIFPLLSRVLKNVVDVVPEKEPC